MPRINLTYGDYGFSEVTQFNPLQEQCNVQYQDEIGNDNIKENEVESFFSAIKAPNIELVSPQCTCLQH